MKLNGSLPLDGDAARISEARLLIHAPIAFAGRMSSFRSVLRRLRGLRLEAPQVQSRMRVQVANLQGRELRCLDTSEPLIELPLLPDTYDVTVTLGNIRRRYTMTLAPGASCDLHLRFAHSAASWRQ
jgi:hypothetical protein